jgi:uncharacterized oligopeptide transporter (OPT) family protein
VGHRLHDDLLNASQTQEFHWRVFHPGHFKGAEPLRHGTQDIPAVKVAGVEESNQETTWLNHYRLAVKPHRRSGQLSCAPANLMAVLIGGLLERKLPWGLIMIGVCLALFIELLGMHSLTFAVGAYLPLSSTLPTFMGGVVRKIPDRRYRRKPDDLDEREGTLLSSGLIAGGALVGVLAAFLHFVIPFDDEDTGPPWSFGVSAFVETDAVSGDVCRAGISLLRGAGWQRNQPDVSS